MPAPGKTDNKPAMKTFLLRALLTVNVLACTAMVFTFWCGYIDPTRHPRISTLGLLFPYTIAPVCALLLLSLAVRRRYALIEASALIACAPSIKATIPLNFGTEAPSDAIKVMSYNVYLFDKWDYPRITDNAITSYLCRADADIVCVQEAMFEKHDSAIMMQQLARVYPYHHIRRENKGNTQMLLLSKHPIISSEKIDYPSSANMSMAYEVDVAGDTMLVVNNHFETNSLSAADRTSMEAITGKGKEAYGSRLRMALTLHGKLSEAARIRAPQARAVSEYIKRKAYKYVIVCGDFNDHPLSYTVRTVQKGLINTFADTGRGFGHTYRHNNINVRIDHILCSKTLKPYLSHADTSIHNSDHYPVVCYLKPWH